MPPVEFEQLYREGHTASVMVAGVWFRDNVDVGLSFVCCDLRFAEAARGFDLEVVNPEDGLRSAGAPT